MKVCILSTVDMSRMTMVSIYTDYFDKHGIDYDFIYVDKFKDSVIGTPKNLYVFSAEGFENSGFARKMLHYWKMRRFATNIFKREKYDFLVVWGSLTVFIFADIIRKYFSGRSCANIRDFFFNDKKLMNLRMGIAMEHCVFNTVSSDKLIEYLPGKKFISIQSLNEKLLGSLEPRTQLREKGKPLRIIYIGWIGRLEYAYRLIDSLKNDSRYELYFVGMGSEDIDKYIDGKNINNVRTHGKFEPDETSSFLAEADIIYNLYGSGDMHFDTALSIKLYYAIFMHTPLLGFPGTYTLEVAKRCKIGFEVNKEDYSGLGDDLYEFYYNMDLDEVAENCDEYIRKIRENNKSLGYELDDIFNTQETDITE